MIADFRGEPSRTAAELRKVLVEAFRPVFAGVREVVLFGYHTGSNAGDSLIWLGQLNLLATLGVTVRRVGVPGSADPGRLASLPPEVAVVFSGGGNFGDLWQDVQHDRERVIAAAGGRRVIQLPQSLSYRNEANVPIMRKVLAEHGDVLLAWRDEQSYQAAQVMFPDATSILVPDVAFALGPRRTTGSPHVPLLRIARTDQEGGELAALRLPDGVEADWQGGRRPVSSLLEFERRFRPFVPDRIRIGLCNQAATAMAGRATALVSGAHVVLSDRLHAHVLCTLLGIPNVMLDTRYGKVSSFIRTWTAGDELVHIAGSPDEAVSLARVLAEKHTSPH